MDYINDNRKKSIITIIIIASIVGAFSIAFLAKDTFLGSKNNDSYFDNNKSNSSDTNSNIDTIIDSGSEKSVSTKDKDGNNNSSSTKKSYSETGTEKKISVTGVALNKKTLTLAIGDKYNLIATVSPDDATNKNVSWASSNTKVATVKDGKITAKSEGTVIITVATADGNKKSTCKVTVSKKKVSATVALSTSSINIGTGTSDAVTVTATVSPDNVEDKTINWTSSNNDVATVDNGVIKGIHSGSAVVTATLANGNSASATINVNSTERIHFISHNMEVTYNADGKINPYTGDAILLESNGYFAMIDLGNVDRANQITNYLRNNGVYSLDFLLFTHMDSDHAGNLQSLLESGVYVKNIWLKNYDVASYRENYVENIVNGVDDGRGIQIENNNPYEKLNKALARYRRIRYLSEYSYLKDKVDNIKILSSDNNGSTYTFKNLKFSMTLYNNKRNVNAISKENYNSISSLILVNGYKVLLTGDDYDTKLFNETAASIGHIDILKVPHHGSVNCSLINKRYNGDVYAESGSMVYSTAINNLTPNYYVVTSARAKINAIRNYYGGNTEMCTDKIPGGAYVQYVDEKNQSLVVDLSNTCGINFFEK